MATRNKDFEIDLKMRAEFSDAQRELVRTQKQLESLSRSVAKANRDIASAGGGGAGIASASKALDTATLSAKQLQAATRQLPMQMTDIFTSLASGQRPLQVLLQQGGQLKDVFGGIGPAARATAGYVMGMVNPLTIGAAAVAGLTFAWHEGQQEQQAFNRALIETGGFAGVTAERMAELSQALADGRTTQSESAAALAKVAASGKFTGEQLRFVSQAALDLERVAGIAVDETVAKFAKLADEPTKAVLALNESTHFLTLEIYEQIKALEEQGREQEAATLAMQTYAGEIERRTAEVEQNLGILEEAWNGLGLAAKKAWDFMLDIGRESTGQEQFQSLHQQVVDMQDTLQTREQGGFSLSFLQLSDQQLRERISTMRDQMAELADANVQSEREATQKAAAQRAEEAAIALDQEAARYASAEEKRAQRIAAVRQKANDAVALALESDNKELVAKIREDEAAVVAAIEAEAKKPKPKKPRKGKDPDAAAQSALANLQRQVALLDEVEDGESRASEESRVRWEIQEGAYRTASQSLKDQLLETAKVLDVERARRKEAEEQRKATEEAKRAYDRLIDALRTPVEVALETAIERVNALNEAMRRGVGEADLYQQSIDRVLHGSIKDAPKFGGLAPEIAGPFGELGRIDEARTQLEKWYQEQLLLLQQFREQKLFTVQALNAEELRVEQQHQQQLRALQSAQTQVMLAGASDMFGSLADIARTYGGEQSRTYRALFALSKAFAVAQAAVALAQNVAEASKVGYPQNLPLIAGAIAQGATIAGLLAQATFGGGSGYATGGHVRGPGTGTSDSIPARLSDYEFVTKASVVRQPGALQFLEDFNTRGMDALYGWARFAEGGLVDASSIRLPAPDYASFPQGAAGLAAPEFRMNLINAFDVDEAIERFLSGPKGDKSYLNMVGRNRMATKQTVMG